MDITIVAQALFFVCVALIIAFFSMREKKKKAEHLEAQLRGQLITLESECDRYRKENSAYKNENEKIKKELENRKKNLDKILESNLTSAPWLAGMMADFITYDIEIEAKKLDWGCNVERQKKVAAIREIRADAKQRIEEAKLAVYQLKYLIALYPSLEDVLETDYSDLDFTGQIPEHDPVYDWIEKDEWKSLSENQRNQLALDRYVQSRKKSKWQIGRDYELSVAFEFMQDGFIVDTCGSYLKFEDMGRDIIARKNGRVYIIQCKYWSQDKLIHEKHIYQLYGTAISYSIENNKTHEKIVPVFVTNISLSSTAKQAAKLLHVTVYENHPLINFPRIKCNIGKKDEFGCSTKIYHLPMDAQYDATRINAPGECYAYTVEEAVSKGFRRAYKWQGGK